MVIGLSFFKLSLIVQSVCELNVCVYTFVCVCAYVLYVCMYLSVYVLHLNALTLEIPPGFVSMG